MTRVLVAGAGVAAVECVLVLRELAGSRVAIELLAPAAELVTARRPLRCHSAASRRAELGPGGRREHRLLPAPGTASPDALWWPSGKIAGRYLTPFLATGSAAGSPLHDREPPTGREQNPISRLNLTHRRPRSAPASPRRRPPRRRARSAMSAP